MTELERIAATLEIHALKARYFRTMDTKDWAGLEAVFAPDLIADFREAAGEMDERHLVHGSAQYIAYIRPILKDVSTVHHGHTPEISFISPTEATGVWAMEDKLWFPADSGMPFRFMHGYGHYHERYVRLADGWRIQATRLSRLRVDVS